MKRMTLVGLLLCVVCGLVSGQTPTPVGLVAAWNFEGVSGGVIPDVSGYGTPMNATLNNKGRVIFDAIRNSYVLDPASLAGTKPGATALYNSKLDFRDCFTLMLWVRPWDVDGDGLLGEENQVPPSLTEVSEQWKFIVGYDAGWGYRMYSMNSGMLFDGQLEPDDGWFPINMWRGASWAPEYQWWDGTGPWHMLLVTFDNWYMYGYIDGIQTYQENWRAGRQSYQYGANWGFGCDNNSVGTRWYMDDVAFFRGYCPPASVAGLYNGTYTIHNVPLVENPPLRPSPPAGMPFCSPAIGAVDEPNLVAWYEFEEGEEALATKDLDADNPAPDAILMENAQIVMDNSLMFTEPNITWIRGNALQSGDNGTLVDPNIPDDYVDCGDVAKFGRARLDRGFTIAAWIYPDNWMMDPNDGNVLSKGGGTGTYNLNVHSGGLRFYVNTQDPNYCPTPNTEGYWDWLKPGRWWFVAVTYKPKHPTNYNPSNPATWGAVRSNETTLYIDGGIYGSTNRAPSTAVTGGIMCGPLKDVTNPLTISSAFRGFQGRIDNVRIFDKALTLAQLNCLKVRHCLPRMIPGNVGNDCTIGLPELINVSTYWLTSPQNYDLVDFSHLSAGWLQSNLYFPWY